jgi:hypothetical protein
MVELGSELRRNSFGSETPAPVFKIVEWRQSRQAGTPQLTAPAVKPDSPDLNDSIPF